MYEFTPADPTIKQPGHPDPLTEKRRIMFVYVPLVMLAGLIVNIATGLGEFVAVVDLMEAIFLNVLGLIWCKIDNREQGYTPSNYFTLAFVVFGILTLVYYLFRSRGFRRGLTSIGWLLLYLAALFTFIEIVGVILILVSVALGILPSSLIK